jgi:hypothetical protein
LGLAPVKQVRRDRVLTFVHSTLELGGWCGPSTRFHSLANQIMKHGLETNGAM